MKQYKERGSITLQIPREIHQKVLRVCEAYGFMRNTQHNRIEALNFLLDVVANDPKTKDLRIKQLHEQSIEIQETIARLSQ